MAADIDELTVNYEEDGLLVVKEMDKVVLSRGAWATVLFRFQQWDKRKNEYGPDRYTIRRYQKRGEEYLQKSKFTISSAEQAAKIIEALQKWIKE